MKKLILALSLLVASTSAMADYMVLDLGDSAYLPECGGMIKTNNGNGRQVNIVLNGVEQCSNFDIIGDDGYVVTDYKNKKIPGPNGDRSGSFTIPSKFNDARYFGKKNSVTVLIKSNSGKHQDTVKIYYTVYGY